jgi:hypothetical protein
MDLGVLLDLADLKCDFRTLQIIIFQEILKTKNESDIKMPFN